MKNRENLPKTSPEYNRLTLMIDHLVEERAPLLRIDFSRTEYGDSRSEDQEKIQELTDKITRLTKQRDSLQ